MRYYPMNVDIAGRVCVVVGGGQVAERKALQLLAAGGAVTVISPAVTDKLKELALGGKLEWHRRCWQENDASGAFLIICATDQTDVNAAAAAAGRMAGSLVNVVDAPGLSDFTAPALISRGELLITVSTGGGSPILARRIREQLEQLYGEQFGRYLQDLAAIRDKMKDCLPDTAAREEFWRAALDAECLELVRQGRVDEAKEKIIGETSGARNQL